ncbi:lytic transglycosylase domain-containing protein [Taylorella equigenitalis]|uniref:Peptidoglycan hydrolase VirB1 n=2 Tax=Taylorella equigenitalis TaxID=29575 RepID=A0A654KF73_TAYEM|nr:lytic transglycosylase domain-containing protein [Taylorella equigenitalis]ADU91073.1 Peptidoglycan hydrolase VirB1 [Taylorella equigenitalis MCE9]AFN36176.1 lytic transglycosylase [Taylorella equigenitalis ATCC 35865]ASY39582.1 peptidoglycan hydrolase [Taylorella equigenitalis]ASY42523.1 peptidoglycan hydrolase [Taylorella equigenitalis]KGK34093.1 peptidoglycan hydrolase [Taylorella equigenitalis]
MKKLIYITLFLMAYSSNANANDYDDVIKSCSPNVAPETMRAIIRVESSFNPYAIGVVGGEVKQPKTLDEALKTVQKLKKEKLNFSMGLAQINRYNLSKYNLTEVSVFNPCSNLKASEAILSECFQRAKSEGSNDQVALQKALSCYFAGNFSTGFKKSKGLSYVDKIKRVALANEGFLVPKINPKVDYTPTPKGKGEFEKVKESEKVFNPKDSNGNDDSKQKEKKYYEWDLFNDFALEGGMYMK